MQRLLMLCFVLLCCSKVLNAQPSRLNDLDDMLNRIQQELSECPEQKEIIKVILSENNNVMITGDEIGKIESPTIRKLCEIYTAIIQSQLINRDINKHFDEKLKYVKKLTQEYDSLQYTRKGIKDKDKQKKIKYGEYLLKKYHFDLDSVIYCSRISPKDSVSNLTDLVEELESKIPKPELDKLLEKHKKSQVTREILNAFLAKHKDKIPVSVNIRLGYDGNKYNYPEKLRGSLKKTDAGASWQDYIWILYAVGAILCLILVYRVAKKYKSSLSLLALKKLFLQKKSVAQPKDNNNLAAQLGSQKPKETSNNELEKQIETIFYRLSQEAWKQRSQFIASKYVSRQAFDQLKDAVAELSTQSEQKHTPNTKEKEEEQTEISTQQEEKLKIIQEFYAESSFRDAFTKVSSFPTNQTFYKLTTYDNGKTFFEVATNQVRLAIKKHEDKLENACDYQISDLFREGDQRILKSKIKNIASGEVEKQENRWLITKKARIEFYD